MKIESIQAIPIRSLPPRPRMSSLGRSTEFNYGIVIIRTDSGIEGFGEISMLWDGTGERACFDVDRLLAPVIMGENPFDIVKILEKMDRAIQFSRASNTAKAAIEMALYDIIGKALNTPVYNLLGGKVRDCVPLSMSVFMDKVDVMIEQALGYVNRGFKTVKVKIGMNMKNDLEAVREIRKALGKEINIRVDANMAWRSPSEAIAIIKKLEEFEVHSIEQPMSPDRLDDIANIRSQVNTPIMLDESIWGPEDAARALKANAVDIFNVYVSESGGLYKSSSIFRIAEAFGVDATIGSMPELGIGTSAQIHLAVSVPRFNCPGDVCGFLYHKDALIMETIKIEDGYAYPLEGPGLGITLDYNKLEEMRTDKN
ncbi:MAG: mandelate racemase/muconate lactonizing enzyme family protein [Desulfitobacteriaceae bacterium]